MIRRGLLVLALSGCVTFSSAASNSNDAGTTSDGGVTNDAGVTDSGTATDSGALVSGPCGDAGPRRIVFVTSTSFSGSLGGLAGAAQACTQIANDAGIPGTFVAWLSTAKNTPTLSPMPSVPLRLPGSCEEIGADLPKIEATATLERPFNETELGEPLKDPQCDVWTATQGYGTLGIAGDQTNHTCLEWTSADGGVDGLTGDCQLVDGGWSDQNVLLPCDAQAARLYCVQN